MSEDMYPRLWGNDNVDKPKARRGNKLYSLEEINKNNWDYGRYLKLGYVVFDFDHEPYVSIIEQIISDRGYKCKKLITDRGNHYMFKTNVDKISDTSHAFNWLGIEFDVKGKGLKQDKKECYQVMKLFGKERKEIYLGGASSDEDLDIAPKWMYLASSKCQNDLTKDMTGGRNTMFHGELMIEAKKFGFSYEEYHDLAYLINDYVLPEGLEKDELETAIRREEWDKLKIGEDKLTTLDKAMDVIDKWSCVLVNSELMFFDTEVGHYSSNGVRIECYIQEKYAQDNISKNGIREVMDQMNIQLNNYTKYQYERNSEYVVCKDKLVSMWKDEVRDITRTIVTDVVYPYAVMTNEEFESYNGLMKKFLDDISCGRKETLQSICECVGCMLAPKNNFGKIFIWYGSGKNGKSTLMNLVAHIMGSLCTSANLLRINDSFALQSVMKGICNITDDIGTSPITETGLLKSVIQGSSIEVNRKYRDPIKWKPNTQFVVGCNDIPRIQDTSGGMTRRILFVPFDLQLTAEQTDVDLEDKLMNNVDDMRYLLTAGIRAFRNAKTVGHLLETDKQRELTEDFIQENKDQISSFYEYLEHKEGENTIGKPERDIFSQWLEGKTTDEVYGLYKEWCNEFSFKFESQLAFSRRFRKKLPTNMTTKAMKISGKTFNTYCFRG